MATVNSVAITILFNYGGTSTNPANYQTVQVVAPWGMSPKCATIDEAINDVFHGKAGSQYAGKMGQYFTAQTLNGASGSGPTGFTTANEVGAF